ncbi:MAG: aminoacetone oxidase family FAD-binding enzyme [Clostridia bacterium]|nr:aminoacetone oxidase family FAD-binding enzyme [Clostridia bacterium]MBQ7913704.1 aminoacetone oxidase family FAD-binding enzyme [Clostridia bacterium]
MSKIAIIGGGAAGLMLAANLCLDRVDHEIVVFERGERVGRKLSATGNGQGNITNLHVKDGGYFSSEPAAAARAKEIVRAYDNTKLQAFFEKLGIILTADDRGRVYPASRQASSLTDGLRYYIQHKGIKTCTGSLVTGIEKRNEGFSIRYKKDGDSNDCYDYADIVVLCTGGNAAKNFGTDGSGYPLAKSFGHTVTPLQPSLVQLKTNADHIKTLKGIRVNDGVLTARTPRGEHALQGDIIFTDYGVSGDAVFRMSAFIVDQIPSGKVELCIDFLRSTDEKTVLSLLKAKQNTYPNMEKTELLFGVVNNQIGRAVMRRAGGDLTKAASLVKRFTLTVTGSLGFDYAQVTKGGIPLSETDEDLQSRLAEGLYFTGEILDVDGECGGYNLQWAFSSACTVAAAIDKKYTK